MEHDYIPVATERLEANEAEFLKVLEEIDSLPVPAHTFLRFRWWVIYPKNPLLDTAHELDNAWKMMIERRNPNYLHLKVFWAGNKRKILTGESTGGVWREDLGGYLEYQPKNTRAGNRIDISIKAGPSTFRYWTWVWQCLQDRFKVKQNRGGHKQADDNHELAPLAKNWMDSGWDRTTKQKMCDAYLEKCKQRQEAEGSCKERFDKYFQRYKKRLGGTQTR